MQQAKLDKALADNPNLRCSICLRWLAYILTAEGEIDETLPVRWIVCRQCKEAVKKKPKRKAEPFKINQLRKKHLAKMAATE